MPEVQYRQVLETMVQRSRKNRYANNKQEGFRAGCSEMAELEVWQDLSGLELQLEGSEVHERLEERAGPRLGATRRRTGHCQRRRGGRR